MQGNDISRAIVDILTRIIMVWGSYIIGFGLIWRFGNIWIAVGVLTVIIGSAVERKE